MHLIQSPNNSESAIQYIIGCYRYLSRFNNQQRNWILTRKKMLYYKSTSNNAGLALDIVNASYERTFKEALVVYGIGLQLTDSREQLKQVYLLTKKKKN